MLRKRVSSQRGRWLSTLQNHKVAVSEGLLGLVCMVDYGRSTNSLIAGLAEHGDQGTERESVPMVV